MDNQRHEPEDGPSPNGARVEDDFVRALKPANGTPRRRLPAALPFAIVGILAISSIAFGANVMRSIVTPDPSATPVIVGDENPTDAPTLAPTENPTAVVTKAPTAVPTAAPTAVPTAAPTAVPTAVPTKAPTAVPTKAPTAVPTKAPTAPPVTTRTAPPIASMTLTAVASGKVVNLTWSKYTGDYFKYYGIVRSETDAQATLPLGTVPYLYFEDINTLSAVDTTKAGHTYHYRAYAFTDATFSTGNVVPNCQANTILAMSNVVDVTIPAAASQPPVASLPPTQDLGALIANDTLSGVTFNWTGYTGGSYSYYKLVYELTSSGKTPSYPNGSPYWAVPPVGATSAGPINIPPGDYQVRVQAIGSVNGSAYALAQTSVIHVHISVPASPTPPPAP